MFCKKSKNDNYIDKFSVIKEVIIPIYIILSTLIISTMTGFIIKSTYEKNNITILLPLIIVIILNIYHMQLSVIRYSNICFVVGYIIYDIFVLFYNNNYTIVNTTYFIISFIQLLCNILCFSY